MVPVQQPQRLGRHEHLLLGRGAANVFSFRLALLAGTVGCLFLGADAGLGEPRGEPQSASFPGKPGEIAFVRIGNRRGIYVTNPTGGKLRRVTRGYDIAPAWSPDGRRVGSLRGDLESTSATTTRASTW